MQPERGKRGAYNERKIFFQKKDEIFSKVHEIDFPTLRNPRSRVQNERHENANQRLDSR
jgi:hypothetical protein